MTSWCAGSLWLVLQSLQLPSTSTVRTVAILLFTFSNTIIIAAQHPEIQVCYNIISNDDVRSGTSAHRVTITEPVSVRRERLFPAFFSLTGCQQCWEHWLTSPPSHSQEKNRQGNALHPTGTGAMRGRKTAVQIRPNPTCMLDKCHPFTSEKCVVEPLQHWNWVSALL